MSESGTLPRPRQVTVVGGFAILASVILVIIVFDAMNNVRSVESRRAVEDFLSKSPGSGLGLSVDEAVDLMRTLVFITGALSAMAFVLAIYVLQRHNGARIALTVVAGALVVVASPIAGFLPITIAVAAAMLWSPPVRDWFAGRAPRPPRAVPPPPVAPPAAPPAVTHAEPDLPAAPSEGSEPAAPPPPPAAYPFGAPTGGVTPPTHAYGQPPMAPPPMGAYPPPAAMAPRRPMTVLIAGILTIVGAILALGFFGLLALALATDEEGFRRSLREEPDFSTSGLSEDGVVTFMWFLIVVIVVWSVVAVVLAVFAMLGAQWARILLTISAALSVFFTLFLSVIVIVLLFTGGANEWYRKDGRAAPQPPPPVW
jgi:amino acid transporter